MKHSASNLFTAFAFTVFAMLFAPASHALPADSTKLLVTVKQGQLNGVMEDSIYTWHNIPYAQPPVGELRYRAPQPPVSWQGVRNAATPGNVAPQFKRTIHAPNKRNEDCLQLNVWAPAMDGQKRPVMIWIHGGGFLVGSGTVPMYNGAHLAANGNVVVVTINYRLGPLGFLYFNDIKGTNTGFDDNLGIRDQVAALQWVHDNIAAFGGDPESVTVFGESAGGISVLTLLAVPSAHGLFRRAIVESASPEALFSPATATALTQRYMGILGVAPGNLPQLMKLPADTLVAAMGTLIQQLMHEPTTTKILAPTIDGKFITEDPVTAIKEGKAAGIDLMIGTNKDESTLLALKRVGITPRNRTELQPYLDNINPAARKNLIATYHRYPRRSGVMEMTTDGIFVMPSIKVSELQAQFGNTYMYRFDWSSVALNVVGLRACHGAELPFVFGTLDRNPGKMFTVMSNKKRNWKLSQQIEQCWANFARYGTPDPKGTIGWNKYTPDGRTTMIFDKTSYAATDPKSQQRIAWTGLSIFTKQQ